jgi:hypothetical protein
MDGSQATGVTQGDAPIPGDSPSPNIGEVVDPESGDELLPFGKHPRFRELNETKRKQAIEIARLKKENSRLSRPDPKLEGAKALNEILSKDPRKTAMVARWLAGEDVGFEAPKTETVPSVDFEKLLEPFNDEAKIVLRAMNDRFNAFDKFEKEARDFIKAFNRDKEAFLNENKKTQEKQLKDWQSAVDADYDSMLEKVGLVDKNGRGDEEFLEVFDRAVFMELAENAQDPQRPSPLEVKRAFNRVFNGFQRKLGKNITQAAAQPKTTGLPPSRPQNRITKTEQKKLTAQEREHARIMQMAKAL